MGDLENKGNHDPDKLKNLAQLLGRIIFAFPFIFFGLRHFINPDKVAQLVPGYLPCPKFWVYLTGSLMIIASIGMILNIKSKWSSAGLILMMFVFIALIYIPVMTKMAILTYTVFIGGALLVWSISKN